MSFGAAAREDSAKKVPATYVYDPKYDVVVTFKKEVQRVTY